jgi:hypothetical protein
MSPFLIRNAECHYADCHCAESRYAEYHYADCHCAESRYTECLYAECHYAEYRDAVAFGALEWITIWVGFTLKILHYIGKAK